VLENLEYIKWETHWQAYPAGLYQQCMLHEHYIIV
jgi:hypothetical protein